MLRKNNEFKRKNNWNAFTISLLVFMVIYSLILASLLVWGFVKSFQDFDDFILGGAKASSLPKKWTLDNYKKAFEVIKYPLPRKYGGGYVLLGEMIFNSVFYAVGCAAIDVMTTACVAYLTIKHRFAFNKVLVFAYYFSMLMPFYGAMGASIKLMTNLRLIHTWPGVFFMKMKYTGGIGFLFFRSVFKTLDDGYSEAAKIDGASHFRVMFQICMPLIKPVILTFFLMKFITYWNDYTTPMIYLEANPTAAYGLFLFGNATANGGEFAYVTYKAAGFMVLLIPIIILFVIFKDKMMHNVTEGGLKG